MCDKKDITFTVLDGTPEENEWAAQKLSESLTDEEHIRAMSDEFAYLDED